MYQDHQGFPRQFYKEQCKEGEEGANKRSVGRTKTLNGQREKKIEIALVSNNSKSKKLLSKMSLSRRQNISAGLHILPKCPVPL